MKCFFNKVSQHGHGRRDNFKYFVIGSDIADNINHMDNSPNCASPWRDVADNAGYISDMFPNPELRLHRTQYAENDE